MTSDKFVSRNRNYEVKAQVLLFSSICFILISDLKPCIQITGQPIGCQRRAKCTPTKRRLPDDQREQTDLRQTTSQTALNWSFRDVRGLHNILQWHGACMYLADTLLDDPRTKTYRIQLGSTRIITRNEYQTVFDDCPSWQTRLIFRPACVCVFLARDSTSYMGLLKYPIARRNT
jgi:hypothetical protein